MAFRKTTSTPEMVAARALYAQHHPLPQWPTHLPAPEAEYGIPDCGLDVPDLRLRTGDRTVYFRAVRGRSGFWYDDIDGDPAWANEDPFTKEIIVNYGRALMDRYTEALADAWASEQGRAMLNLVWSRLPALA